MNKGYVFAFFLIIASTSAFAKINTPIMVTNSPYKNGINDSCGGCVSPQVCQSGTCATPTNYSTDSASCGVSQTACGTNQACLSGGCVSTTDVTSCFNGSSYTTCSGGSCGGYVSTYTQGNKWMTGLCACSSGIFNDNNNCGSCGNACTGSTAYCSYGQCVDANLCGDGGCAGTSCANATQIGQTCTDSTSAGKSIYAGGNLEVSPADNSCNWANAQSYCASLGAGWGLPTQEQLAVLYANNSKVGMSTSSTSYYWSSEQYMASYPWMYNFNNGGQYYTNNYSNEYVRCVRSL